MSSMSESIFAEERIALPERLLKDRLVVTFPDRGMTNLVAGVEVMVQEGITCFSVPAGQLYALPQVQGMYSLRACFGVHDVDVDTIEDVLALAPSFITVRRPDSRLIGRCHQAGIAVVVPALTPTEVQTAWDEPVSAVVIVPAEVMGASYAEYLPPLVPDTTLMARGGLGAYSARRWDEAGAVALFLDDALLGDAFTGGSLGSLRERCQTFRQAVDVA